jgi:hypothetical protein
MNRKHRLPLMLTLAVACVGTAVGTAFAVGTDTASDPLTRDAVYHEGHEPRRDRSNGERPARGYRVTVPG